MLDEALPQRIRADMQSAIDSGARGTPTFFLGETRHSGAHDARTLIATIEAQRKELSIRRRS